jgi:hypothetical protein
MIDKFQTLIDTEDGFTDVHVFRLPDGGVAISLSHRITSDYSVLIRVADSSDVILDGVMFEEEGAMTPEELETSRRTNLGGPWKNDPEFHTAEYHKRYEAEYGEPCPEEKVQ